MTDMYLGDGVYLSYDGYQLWLAANDHTCRVIALEPEVFAALVKHGTDLLNAPSPPSTHVSRMTITRKGMEKLAAAGIDPKDLEIE